MGAVTTLRPRYEADFYAWAMDQAAALRAMAAVRSNAPIDWQLVAEEVEDLGRSERHAGESWLEQIIAHLLKLEYSRLAEPRDHWRSEVTAFRLDLRRRLSPSIERLLRQELDEHWRAGRLLAARSLVDSDPAFADLLPAELPYSLDLITGDWLPEQRAAD
jgi:hypothetical protein